MKTITLNSDQLADFYGSGILDNELYQNEYVIIKSAETGELIGPYKRREYGYDYIEYRTLDSQAIGYLKPLNKDPYQIAYIDSLYTNQVTFACGKAGSGKSLLGLGYAFQELEKGHIDRIYLFANPMSAKGAARLGFLPGDLDEKLMGCQIGNILTTKLGSRIIVEELINKEQLIIVPMSNSRGIDIPKHSFVYSTESQNMDIYLMKLLLQRIPDEVQVIIEGDVNQTDDAAFEGSKNGMTRAIEVLSGKDYVGIVELQNCYRGRLAADAEGM